MSADIMIVPDPEHAHLIEVWEPLPTKAPNPNLTQPYCCYVNTVIFYHRPYIIRRWHHFSIYQGKLRAWEPGRTYQEWDRVETTLRIDAVITHEGQRFRIYNGRVVWKNKRWWMKRDARREK